jgi:hypothetical protein
MVHPVASEARRSLISGVLPIASIMLLWIALYASEPVACASSTA